MNKEIYRKAAESLNIPIDTIKEVYTLYWGTIRNKLEDLNLKTTLSEEEFNKLKTSINIPSLGKLYASYQRYTNLQTKRKIIQHVKIKKDKTTPQ